jgi:hypothetical protein
MRPNKMQIPTGLTSGIENLNKHIDRRRVQKSNGAEIDPKNRSARTPKLTKKNIGQNILGTHIHFPGQNHKRSTALPADTVSPDISHGSFLSHQSHHTLKAPPTPTPLHPPPTKRPAAEAQHPGGRHGRAARSGRLGRLGA